MKADAPAPATLPRRTRRLVLGLWLLGLLLCAGLIARTPFVADLSAFLPADPDARQQLLIEQVQSGLPARTLLLAIEGGDAASRAAESATLATHMRDSGRFQQVHNGQTESFDAAGRWLFEHRYLLSPAVDAQRYTESGLREGLAETLSLLGTPAGSFVKPLLPRDPTGETLRIAETLLPATAPRQLEGVWASRDGERAVLMAVTQADGGDLDAHEQTLNTLQRDFQARHGDALRLQVSGAPLFGVLSRSRIEHEVRWLAVAAGVMVGGVLLLAFASLPALAVAALPVLSGVVLGIATVGTVFGVVHGITLGFGATLIGEGVDYAIYYLIQARQGGWRAWLRSGWPTVRLGVLTSVCGFSALVLSGFPGLMQLGAFSIAGLVGTALCTRWVLPVLMPQGAAGSALRLRLGRLGAALLPRLPRLRPVVVVLGAGSAVLLVLHDGLWSADPAALSPVPPAAMALDAQLRTDLGPADGGTLVVIPGPDAQTVLRAAEDAGQRLGALVEAGTLGGYTSPARWLPSLHTQQQRQAALPDAAALRVALDQATAGGPLPAQRLSAFVDDLQAARTQALLTPDTLAGTAVEPLLQALLLHRPDGSWAALLPLEAAPGVEIDGAAVDAALAGMPQAQVLAIGSELSRLYAHYLSRAQVQALLGAAGVTLLMALSLRSPRRLLAVVQPLVLAVLLTMAVLALAGVSLGILHLVGLLLVVAVGSNYALFFDLLQRQGTPDADTVASLLLANGTTVLAFGLIGASDIPVLSAVGTVVAPGALLSLLLAAIFVRGGESRPDARQEPPGRPKGLP